MGFSVFTVQIQSASTATEPCCSAGPCNSEYTVYDLTIQSQGTTWPVQKRYTDFVQLESKLRDKFWYIDDLPTLPPKFVLFSKSASAIDKRRKGLEEWLRKILEIGCFSQSGEMSDFLHALENAPVAPLNTDKQAQAKKQAVAAPSKPAPAPVDDAAAKVAAWKSGGAAKLMQKVKNENEEKWAGQAVAPAPAPASAEADKRKWWTSGAANTLKSAVQENNAKWSNSAGETAAAASPPTPPSRGSVSSRPLLQNLFDCMDGRTGRVEHEELTIFIRVVGGRTPPSLSTKMESGSITLTQKEFIDAFEEHLGQVDLRKTYDLISDIFKLSSSSRAQLTEIFQIVDKSHNGYVETDELLDLGTSFSSTFTPEKCNKLLSRMDYNHDGKIALDEFLAFFGNFCQGMPDRQRERGLNGLKNRAISLNL